MFATPRPSLWSMLETSLPSRLMSSEAARAGAAKAIAVKTAAIVMILFIVPLLLVLLGDLLPLPGEAS
jgi:hypothetical protein